MERPEYVVLGRNTYDQRWIDRSIEGGVGGCGWQRPAPRPKEWSKAKASPPLKRNVIQRVRDRVIGPVEESPAPALAAPPVSFPPVPHVAPPAVERPPVPPPAPRRRDPVDELLDP